MERDPEDVCETSPSRYARPHNPRRARPSPTLVSIWEHYLAATVMMVTSSMVSTFWVDNPLPFCSRYWILIGGNDECFWKPNAFMILAACIAYSSAALWWYNQHKRWPHQAGTVAIALLVGIGLSLVLRADMEHILRNTLTWSIFSGLVVGAIMDRGKTSRGGSSRI